MGVRGIDIISEHRLDNAPFIAALKESEKVARTAGSQIQKSFGPINDLHLATRGLSAINSIVLTLGGSTAYWGLELSRSVLHIWKAVRAYDALAASAATAAVATTAASATSGGGGVSAHAKKAAIEAAMNTAALTAAAKVARGGTISGGAAQAYGALEAQAAGLAKAAAASRTAQAAYAALAAESTAAASGLNAVTTATLPATAAVVSSGVALAATIPVLVAAAAATYGYRQEITDWWEGVAEAEDHVKSLAKELERLNAIKFDPKVLTIQDQAAFVRGDIGKKELDKRNRARLPSVELGQAQEQLDRATDAKAERDKKASRESTTNQWRIDQQDKARAEQQKKRDEFAEKEKEADDYRREQSDRRFSDRSGALRGRFDAANSALSANRMAMAEESGNARFGLASFSSSALRFGGGKGSVSVGGNPIDKLVKLQEEQNKLIQEIRDIGRGGQQD